MNSFRENTAGWESLSSQIITALRIKKLEPGSLTTSFNFARSIDYLNSPRPHSISRKLLNAFLKRLSMLRLFSTGQWLDIGGVRVYGEWLGISQERYQVLNLAGISEGIEGNIEETATLDFSKQYDGIISLNCFYMMKNPSCAVSNAMDFLKSGGIVVLDFSTHHYWYKGEDGEHWQSFYPREIDDIVSRHLQNWMLIPIGNVFQATLDYYARRMPLKNLKYFLRFMGLTLGSLDHDPTSAMHYVVIGCKK